MRNVTIVESNVEPNKEHLWFYNGRIKWFGPNGWEDVNPQVLSTTTTTTPPPPPVEPTYLVLTSTVATFVYVAGEIVNMNTPIKVEVGSQVNIEALEVDGYSFIGFYDATGHLIQEWHVLAYTIPSTGTSTIELRYSEIESTTTTTTSTPPPNVE